MENVASTLQIPLQIAIGRSRHETNWRNVDMSWADFVEKVSWTHRTTETQAEYVALPKSRQDEIKDVGGFVGGCLSGGRRKNQNILNRCLITLDVDNTDSMGGWEDFKLKFNTAAVMYTTHKHCPKKPRYRLVIPLDRPVFSDEYVAIGRYVAGVLDIEQFDPTTFEPARLMFWPSTSSDGEFLFDYNDGSSLKADDILAQYRDWRNIGEWAYSTKNAETLKREAKKQGNPLEKQGVIGAFCRTYDVHDVLEAFLFEEYSACDTPGRYTYTQGSTAAGLVVYDDVFAYSHHGTDPASGKLCNAFDLVRLHKFGLRDEGAKEDTPVHKLPSFTAMLNFVQSLEPVRRLIVSERLDAAKEDFDGVEVDAEQNKGWQGKLSVDRKGNIYPTIDNALIILENDPRLKGRLAFDEFAHRGVAVSDLPWLKVNANHRCLTDSDDSAIRHYFEKYYGFSVKIKIDDALRLIMLKNSFHPIKRYLEAQIWDGKPRLETLFIDYLGAKDTEYTRVCTRTSLVAAVARIYEPGVKFDSVLTLIGRQSIGKSTVLRRVGRIWFSDNLETMQGKDALEQLQGAWIIELGELSSLRRTELEAVKHFITKQIDRFRVAYGHRVEEFPRQCVFFGTTNKGDFLKDETGNRRWWPIDCVNKPTKSLNELTETEVDQIWAEAFVLHQQGHKLFLPDELREAAEEVQWAHIEADENTGLIAEYLDRKLPANWYELEPHIKRAFITGDSEWCKNQFKKETLQRNKICVQEIWSELYGGDLKTLDARKAREIRSALAKVEGWRPYDLSKCKGRLKFGFYGLQKAFIRIT